MCWVVLAMCLQCQVHILLGEHPMHQPRLVAGSATCRSLPMHAPSQLAYTYTPLLPPAGHYGATYGRFAYVSGGDLKQRLCSDGFNQLPERPTFLALYTASDTPHRLLLHHDSAVVKL
jgi:hypothetical protein